MNDFIEVRQLATIMFKQWRVIVFAVVLSAALGYGVSRNLAPVYEATSTLLVGQSIQATDLNSTDIEVGEHLALTYAEVGRRQPVLDGTVEALELDTSWQQLRDRVRIDAVEGTQLLEISVEAATREEARRIADEIARQMILLSPSTAPSPEEAESQLFLEERLESLRLRIENAQSRIEELESEITTFDTAAEMRTRQIEIDSLEQLITNWESNYAQLLTLTEGDSPVNLLAQIEAAEARPQPIRPRLALNTLLSGILGLGLALGVIVFRQYTDDSLRTTDDLERVLGLTALGAISQIRAEDYRGKLISGSGPFSPISEAFNVIRSNIGFRSEGKLPGVILVTSAAVGEGKSLTAANLGIIMARSGINAVIIDADLRRPVQHKIFEVANEKGVAELLGYSGYELLAYLSDSGVESLQVVTSGRMPTNPAESFNSDHMDLVFAKLVDAFDMVIVDGPPILTAADAAVLASKVDAVIMVVESGRTRRREATQAVKILQQAGARVLGAVLNRAAPTAHSYRYAPSKTVDEDGESEGMSNYIARLRPSGIWKTDKAKRINVTANGQHNREAVSDEGS